MMSGNRDELVRSRWAQQMASQPLPTTADMQLPIPLLQQHFLSGHAPGNRITVALEGNESVAADRAALLLMGVGI